MAIKRNQSARPGRTHIMTAVVMAACVSLSAHAQEQIEPAESQLNLPAQEVERLQQESEALKQDKDDADDPTKAVSPSSTKEQPSGLKDSEKLPAVQQDKLPAVQKDQLPAVQQDKLPAVQKDKLPAVQKQQPVSGEPEFVRVAPASGAPGSPIRIEGRHFGPDRGDRGLYFIIEGRGYGMAIRGWHDNQIMAVVPRDIDPGSAEIRMVSRDSDTILTAIDFEVISAIADRDVLPDDAGRPDTGGPTSGGFAPDEGGFVGACDGPDPAAAIEISHYSRNDDGTYMLHVHAIITNEGRQRYESRANQQSAVIRQGSSVLRRVDWGPNVDSGAHATTFIAVVEDWIPNSEFSVGYEAAIHYDPDINIDDNPNNDDCNPNNNVAKLTPADIAEAVGVSR